MRATVVQLLNIPTTSANAASPIVDMSQIVNFSIQETNGAVSGSLIIEVSNSSQVDPTKIPAAEWAKAQNDVALSTAGSNMYQFANFSCKWLKVRYAYTSGSGSLVVNMLTKGV